MPDKSLSRIEKVRSRTTKFFRGLKLSNENLPEEDLSGKDFLEVNFKRSSFREASFNSSIFLRSHLNKADLDGAGLDHSIFTETALNEAQFGKCSLRNSRFLNSDLTKVSFNNAVMTGASIINSIGYKASFIDADLSKAAIVNCDFSYADLSGADLSGSDLSLTSLYRANLENTDLTGARLMNTSFERVKGLTEEQRKEIKLKGGLVSPRPLKAIRDSFQGLSKKTGRLVAGGFIISIIVVAVLALSLINRSGEPENNKHPSPGHHSNEVSINKRFPALDAGEVPNSLEPGLIFEYSIRSQENGQPYRIETAEKIDIKLASSNADSDSLLYIRFSGYVSAPENRSYKLNFGFDDHVTLFIDDEKVLDRDGTDQVNIDLILDQGYHRINGFFVDYGGQYFFRMDPGQAGLSPSFDTSELKSAGR